MRHVGAFCGAIVATILYAVVFCILPGSLVLLLLLWSGYDLSVALQFVVSAAVAAGITFAARDTALYYMKDEEK